MSTSSSSSSISAASAASGDGTIPSASAPVTILTNGTTSISQLFPTPTGYNANNNPSGKKLNVYYLVVSVLPVGGRERWGDDKWAPAESGGEVAAALTWPPGTREVESARVVSAAHRPLDVVNIRAARRALPL